VHTDGLMNAIFFMEKIKMANDSHVDNSPLEDYRFFHHWFSGVKTP
jgi:hypothetical protein